MRYDLSILEKTRELGVGSYEPFCSFVFYLIVLFARVHVKCLCLLTQHHTRHFTPSDPQTLTLHWSRLTFFR